MKKAYLLMTLALLLAGCQNDPEVTDGAPISDLNRTQTTGQSGANDNSRITGDALTDPRHPDYQKLQARSIFFDYDSDAIKAEYVPVVEAHARFLRDNPSRKVLIQGNADERGSREYNLALGQRRADALKSRITLLGAKVAQVESVSLGEEKPGCSDASEDCYAKNRRGDLVY